MKKLRYHIVDVFTDRQFGGNPLAVFTDGKGLSTETMQAIAKEMNLSETTFVLPAKDSANHYRVRIFTPGSELPMAGHPTVGTTFILARESMIETSARTTGNSEHKSDEDVTTVRLEEGVGTIPVQISWKDAAADFIEMNQPTPTFDATFDDRAALAGVISLEASDIDARFPCQVVSCGVPFLYVPLVGLDAARRARPRLDLIEKVLSGLPPEIFVFTTETEVSGSSVHSRMFAPGLGITEDPATGAASGPLGCYLVRHNVVASDSQLDITSEQGIEMGRPSFIRIRIDRDGEKITRVRVGGRCCYVGGGHLELED
ncbi:MAG: trans-2,3-dihydro-3-hydroxyanthranilate isomerase [Acidobacteriota bacterium]|nr:trans-2,3-dihydro-3-hydroxyanthranilate isomerase [Acidobacteriota bacterium]